jgi:hypothetical protein
MSKRNLLTRATIRNARLCKENENIGHQTLFNIERDRQGWDFVENATLVGVSNGFLFLSATNENPGLSRSSNFAPVDANLYTEVVLRYKYATTGTASKGKLYFTTVASPLFDEDKSEEFDLIQDGKWHNYTINMGPVTNWVGYISNLKIVFADTVSEGDEVFLSSITIRGVDFNVCTDDSCTEDDTLLEISESFNGQTLNSTPANWIFSGVGDDRKGLIALDPISATNNVMRLLNETGSFAGPEATRLTQSPIYKGSLSLRFYASSTEGRILLLKDTAPEQAIFELKLDTDGYAKYRQGSSTYTNFSTPQVYKINTWHDLLIEFDGELSSSSVYFDGVLVGTIIPYIFAGNATAIKIYNEGSTSNSLYIDDVILLESRDVGICPGIGKQGNFTGSPITEDKFDIVEGVNDSIYVDINNYGSVLIKLTELRGASPLDIRDELERQIASIDLGGYASAEVTYVDDKFSIKSGSYGFDSTVSVEAVSGSTLFEELGFTEGTQEGGRPHATSFSFTNQFRAKTYDILNWKSQKTGDYPIIQNPSEIAVEIGSSDAGLTSRKNVIPGTAKTVIDFYHRATNEGLIEEIFFHGQLPASLGTKAFGSQGSSRGTIFNTGISALVEDYSVVEGDILSINEPGYGANGEYRIRPLGSRSSHVELLGDVSLPIGNELNFSIYNVAKVKHFRLKKDGTLDLINEVRLGIEEGGVLYTAEHDTYKINVKWYVHKGDLLGIYNATQVYTGNDFSEQPDALYFYEDGDLIGTNISVGVPEGQGVRGIGLYGKSRAFQNKAVYDISFEDREAIEFLKIKGKLQSERKEYNLTTAINSGFNLETVIGGTHFHRVERTTDGNILDIEQPNVGYNVPALTDGEQFASNGFVGAFEQNVENASYFYIDGDGEWVDTEEFPPTGIYLHRYISGYVEDPFDIRMFWNVNKLVYKWKMFFKEYPNACGFFLEWLREPGNDQLDGSRTGYEKIGDGNTSEFSKVKLDKMIINKEALPDSDIYARHFQTVFDAYPGEANPDGGPAFVRMLEQPYTVISKEFENV